MITPEDYTERRKRLMHSIGSGLILLPPNPVSIYSHDKNYKYRHNSNIFYYSGITQEETIIAIDISENKSYLFILDNNKEREQWDGKRLDREEAGEISGFMMVYPTSELHDKLVDLFKMNSIIHYPLGILHQLDQIVNNLADQYEVKIENPNHRLDNIRLIKDKNEIELMIKAVEITVNAHLEAIQQTEIGMAEYELEAIYGYHFQINGARLPMQKSTVAAGKNGIYLHHSASSKIIEDGDLILVDTGCEYKGYTADVARTWPANGSFKEGQRELYLVVLEAHKTCLDMVKPGIKYWDIHDTAVSILTDGLLNLGLLTGDKEQLIEDQAYKRFFMHSIGHFIGLDGHDVSSIDRREIILQPGMILTIEPGIYVPDDDSITENFRGVGIRIEDNVLVTSKGNRNLSGDLPIEISEIEELVGELVAE